MKKAFCEISRKSKFIQVCVEDPSRCSRFSNLRLPLCPCPISQQACKEVRRTQERFSLVPRGDRFSLSELNRMGFGIFPAFLGPWLRYSLFAVPFLFHVADLVLLLLREYPRGLCVGALTAYSPSYRARQISGEAWLLFKAQPLVTAPKAPLVRSVCYESGVLGCTALRV